MRFSAKMKPFYRFNERIYWIHFNKIDFESFFFILFQIIVWLVCVRHSEDTLTNNGNIKGMNLKGELHFIGQYIIEILRSHRFYWDLCKRSPMEWIEKWIRCEVAIHLYIAQPCNNDTHSCWRYCPKHIHILLVSSHFGVISSFLFCD